MNPERPSVLVFAGTDPSGGAGIQADIQAIAACGAHPLSVVTALTVQNNDRVFAVHPVPSDLLRQQAEVLIDKIAIAAVKIGIVGNRANAEMIVSLITELRLQHPELPVVLDPVLASGHGDALSSEDAVHAITPLIEVATLITPNLLEASALCAGERRVESQAQSLLARGVENVLIKGGHAKKSGKVVNTWFGKGSFRSWNWPRLQEAFHGSGCTLASAIAAWLAQGKTIEQSVDLAQAYCHRALESAYAIAEGQRMPSRLFAYLPRKE